MHEVSSHMQQELLLGLGSGHLSSYWGHLLLGRGEAGQKAAAN